MQPGAILPLEVIRFLSKIHADIGFSYYYAGSDQGDGEISENPVNTRVSAVFDLKITSKSHIGFHGIPWEPILFCAFISSNLYRSFFSLILTSKIIRTFSEGPVPDVKTHRLLYSSGCTNGSLLFCAKRRI